jgi:ABC-2 type transport system ATP-binding protein
MRASIEQETPVRDAASNRGRLDESVPTALSAVDRLSVEGVSKSWDKGSSFVLDAVSLAVGPGTVTSLVGSNGAGKTTLLRIVAGLIEPDRGAVFVDGLHPRGNRREYQRRVGLLSAGQTGLYARFTVVQHLEYWARIAFVERRARASAVATSIERFALGPIAGRRADRLSMGQRQRVRVAMTFLHEPRLVLLDEPLTSLDDEGSSALVGTLRTFVREGGAALWCAPSADEIEVRVTRALTLSNGRLADS